MRVITGTAKGHKLFSPIGRETRPTSDKVKESVFSIIQGHIPESTVLDLFAGSGALGIEALSRGARWCDFVEKDKTAASVIIKNLQKTHFDNCELHQTDFSNYLARCKRKYDVVFIDPPYKKGLCSASAELLFRHGLLSAGAIIVCETAADEEVSCPYPVRGRYRYGDTSITVFENKVIL